MTKATIQSPKVFISYAWENEEYKERVRSLATDLVSDRVDVVLDQWSLKEGNDMYAFMEESVTDSSVTNVLILLSPQYAQKADAREGGVGTETQIISPKVYGKVDQTKFLPVVFLRDDNGKVCKPAYLDGTLHFDLSDPRSFGCEYKRLVRRLYGIETHRKPELGSQPAWLESDDEPSLHKQTALSFLRSNEPPQVKRKMYDRLLEAAFQELLNWNATDYNVGDGSDYIELYISALQLRDAILEAVEGYPYIDDGPDIVAKHFERFRLDLNAVQSHGDAASIKRTLLHELFIYLVAIMVEYDDNEALGRVLGYGYLLDAHTGEKRGFGLFYNHDEKLEDAVRERDSQRWIAAMGKFWLDHLNINACRRESFILADEICYNVAIMNGGMGVGNTWFPLAYIYDDDNQSIFRGFSEKLRSNRQLNRISAGLGYSSIGSFCEAYREMEDAMKSGAFRNHRFPESYYDAPLFCHFVMSDQLGVEV